MAKNTGIWDPTRTHALVISQRVWNVSFGQNSKLCRFPTGCLHETADGPKANNMNSKDMCSQKHVHMKSKIKVVPVCRKWDKRWKQQRRRKKTKRVRKRERERDGGKIYWKTTEQNKHVHTKSCLHKKSVTQQGPLYATKTFLEKDTCTAFTQETPTTKTFYIKTPLHTASVCPLQQWDHTTEVGMVQNSRPWRPKMLVIFRMSEYPSQFLGIQSC